MYCYSLIKIMTMKNLFNKFVFTVVLISFQFTHQVNATDWYVDNAATGANNGASWTDAWQSFAAINWGSLQPNDTVFVKEGIYIGSSSSFAYDEVTNINIKNNEVYNVTPEGIELKPGTRDCVVEGNIFYDIYNNYNNQPIVTIGAIEIDQDVHNRTPDNSYSSNPNHIIKENIIHDTYTGIRAGSGCKIYNNIIYSTTYHGIYADNVNRDDYLRQIYHNTINLPSSYSITVNGATTDIRNNIGSSETGNLATDNSYFVNTQSGHEDFHLIVNTAPIDAGENVGITQDFEGNIRPDLFHFVCQF